MRVTKERETINTKDMVERQLENESQGLGTESRGAPTFNAEEELPAKEAKGSSKEIGEGSLVTGKPREESIQEG